MKYLNDYAEFSKKTSARQRNEQLKNIRQSVSTLNRTSQEVRGWSNFVRNLVKERSRAKGAKSSFDPYKTSGEVRNWLGFGRNLRNDSYQRGRDEAKDVRDAMKAARKSRK